MPQAVIKYLSTLPLFAGVDAKGVRDLFEIMGLVTYSEPGRVIFDVGDKPDAAYIVSKGVCALSVPIQGRPAREVARLARGAVVGELCLVRPAPRTLRLSVVEPADVIVINGPGFHRLRKAGHPGAYQVLRNVGVTMCERLRDTNELLELEWRGETRDAPVIAPLTPAAKQGAWQRLVKMVGRQKGGAA